MQKFLFSLVIILSFSLLTLAQSTITVSGTVTNSANNTIVPNNRVSISINDSLNSFYFHQHYFTDSNGVYSATIQNYPMGAIISITAFGMFTTYQQNLVSSPFIANFSICVPTAAFIAYPDTSTTKIRVP